MIMWNYSSSTLNSLIDSCASDLGIYGNMGAHDFVIVRPASVTATMKDTPWQGGVVCPETYHGTKMNKRALDFHTQLHDWSDSQRLSTIVKRHPRLLSAKGSTEVFLPIKRLAHIENWTRDVNKYYHPERGPRGRSGSFMVIDVSKYHMKVDKTDEVNRVKSANYPSLAKGRVVSAVSTMGVRRRFFGNDVHTVTNKLVDTQMHYSAQRKDLYSASTKKSQHANKDGRTDDEATLDISESDTLSTFNTSTKHSEQSEEVANPIEKDILQPKITARSWSNRMLNVISIDDCKLTCRYRPQTIKETHEPPGTKPVHKESNKKETRKPGKKANKGDAANGDIEQGETGTGEDADDEGGNSDDITDTSEPKPEQHVANGIDTNNNEHIHSAENSETNNNSSHSNNKHSQSDEKLTNDEEKDSTDGVKTQKTLSSESNRSRKLPVKSDRESNVTPSDKTSYGRITNLYSSSQVTTNSRDQQKKKQNRVYKINNAINDVVQDRKVMNSMERDFDTRTSQFGRTIVDKSEGSDMFRKLHSNLRKKIDNYLDTHSAIRAQQFYEMRRKNSASTTPTPPRENGQLVNNK